MKHEEFLKQVKERAEAGLIGSANPQDVLKLLAIIEKLKEQQRKMYFPADVWDAGGQKVYDKELDEIVGQG